MSQVDFTNLMVTLAFLAGPAGIAAWAIYWGNLLKNFRTNEIEKFSPLGQRIAEILQARSPEAIQVIHLVGFALPPTVAKIVLDNVPAETLAVVQPYYAYVTMLVGIYIAGQFWYALTREAPVPTATITQEVSAQGAQKTTMQLTEAPPADALAVPALVSDAAAATLAETHYGTGTADPKG